MILHVFNKSGVVIRVSNNISDAEAAKQVFEGTPKSAYMVLYNPGGFAPQVELTGVIRSDVFEYAGAYEDWRRSK